jgi:iron(III) transport system permease protein
MTITQAPHTAPVAAPSPNAGDPLPRIFLGLVCATSALILLLLAIVIWLSFRDGTPGDPQAHWSLAHYPEIFLDSFTWKVLADTVGFAVVSVVVSLAFGVAIAWLVERTDLGGKRIIFIFMALGLLIPGFASAMGWLFLLHPRIGLVNAWLNLHLGLAAPLNIATIAGMGWVQGLNFAPLAFVMTAAVLRATDPTLEESAQMSGAGFGRTLWRVTLPLAWPGVLAAGIYIFTLGFAAFDVPAIIGWSNRIYTFSTYLVLQLSPTETLPRYGAAAALSVVMIVFAAIFGWWYRRMQARAHRYQVVRGKAYHPKRLVLGRRAGILSWLFIGTYLLLGKLLPLTVLVWASVLPYFQLPSVAALATASFARYQKLPWDLIATVWRTRRC